MGLVLYLLISEFDLDISFKRVLLFVRVFNSLFERDEFENIGDFLWKIELLLAIWLNNDNFDE